MARRSFKNLEKIFQNKKITKASNINMILVVNTMVHVPTCGYYRQQCEIMYSKYGYQSTYYTLN